MQLTADMVKANMHNSHLLIAGAGFEEFRF